MKPLKGYVIVKQIKEECKSGIILPEISGIQKGIVIASGSKQVKSEDTVIYTGGTKYEEYLILHISSILAVL